MFLYKDNRFHFNNISFCLPDNVLLNSNCDDYHNCIEFSPVNEAFRIIIYGKQCDGGAKQFFADGEAEECYCWVSETSTIAIGELTGYTTNYKSTYNTYVEYRVDVKDENDANVFGILIHSKAEVDIEKTIMHKAVQELLQSMKNE